MRIRELERQLGAREKPKKAPLPAWLVADLKLQGITIYAKGVPDLKRAPREIKL